MPSIEEFNCMSLKLENLLILRTYPIAVKMLEKDEDIPDGAIRPKQERGFHLAQCQAFAMNRRSGETIAMLKEDNWCWAPLMGFGLVEDPHDAFIDNHSFFPRFEVGKYIGVVSAPLKTANFEPDVVLIYSNTAQLLHLVAAVKKHDRELVHSVFDRTESCVYAIVPVIENGEYRITIPDPGEYERAMAGDDEMIFSIPASKLEGLVEALQMAEKDGRSYRHQTRIMMPDFPQPSFYKELFEKWGLDID